MISMENLVQLVMISFPELDAASTTSSQARITESIQATATANETAEEAHDMLEVLENKRKLKWVQIMMILSVHIISLNFTV